MKISRLLVVGVLAIALAIPAMAATPTFSGDVEADFTGAGILTIPDGEFDVGLPGNAPGGTVTGWNIKDLRLTYDSGTDTLYVGINAFGIAGDADGNGNPSTTATWLSDNGGADLADFALSECFAVFFDLDQDGDYDVIAGVSGTADISGASVNVFNGSPASPQSAFGSVIPGHAISVYASPSSTDPDIEFAITNFSTLPDQAGVGNLLGGFKVQAYMGSQADDGIGEDSVVYEQSPTTITTITATPTVTPSGGSVSLEVKEKNDGLVPLTDVEVEVTKTGEVTTVTLDAPPDSGDTGADGILGAAEEWVWTIGSGPITLDPTDFVATGSGVAPGDFVVTYPADAQEQDTATVRIEVPDTDIDIKANDSDGPITVCEGATVTLTICEENTGDADLENPSVELYAGAVLIGTFDETSDEFQDATDASNPGVLDDDETWCWDVDVVVTDPTTTFTTIGYGYLDGTLVTWCENPSSPPQDTICDADEIDNVIVNTEECGAFCTFTQGFWGQANGMGCGQRAIDLIADLLLQDGPLTVGVPGNSLTLYEADCIVERLPAGGTPMPLDLGDDVDDYCVKPLPSALKGIVGKQGRYNNVLIGQVVALTLNLRLYEYECTGDVDDLAGWVLPAEFCTIGDDGCPEKFYIPDSLVGFVVASGDPQYPGLLELANAALGGEDISPITIGDIYDAVTALNEGFDECREVVSCPTEEICGNGCDDDFDGAEDCEDIDCCGTDGCPPCPVS